MKRKHQEHCAEVSSEDLRRSLEAVFGARASAIAQRYRDALDGIAEHTMSGGSTDDLVSIGDALRQLIVEERRRGAFLGHLCKDLELLATSLTADVGILPALPLMSPCDSGSTSNQAMVKHIPGRASLYACSSLGAVTGSGFVPDAKPSTISGALWPHVPPGLGARTSDIAQWPCAGSAVGNPIATFVTGGNTRRRLRTLRE